MSAKLPNRVSALISDAHSESFDHLARELFSHQFAKNLPYQNYCQALGTTPEAVNSWQEIPALPTNAFKYPDFPLTCGQPTKTTFLTSGTTGEARGAHHFPDTSLYETSIKSAWPHQSLPTYFLAPSAIEAPHSSLSHMLATLNDGPDERFLLKNSRFHLAPLFAALAQDQPLFLIGTALAFLHLIETTGPLPLPPSSQLMETGGYKGTDRSLEKADFYRQLSSHFKVTDSDIHNEYSMTELSSQAYATGSQGRHRFPHWCRALIIDPESGKPLPTGELGYLALFDLANLHSVLAIRTQDFARAHPDGSFTLIGRDPGALPRGCSRTIDQNLSS